MLEEKIGRVDLGRCRPSGSQTRGFPLAFSKEIPMRFMVLLKAVKEGGKPPTKEEFAAMDKFNDELLKAGALLAADGLAPSARGARVEFEPGKKPTVTDGPFAESKELVAGYSIWQMKSLEEAVEWAKRAPFRNGEVVEIRPLAEWVENGTSFECTD